MKLTVLLPFIFLNYWAYCQNQTDRSYIIQNSNVHKLQKIATDFLTLQSQFDTTNIPKQLIIDGKTAYFSHFDANGQVVYATLENESSAISSKIDVIRSGGSSGLNLDGNNIVFGLWDAGPPRETHQEYAGKITVVDSVAISNHATHIAGTLIASGIVSSAKGMAPQASIESYTFSGATAEIAAWAAAGGMISSHSYILANPGVNYQNYGIYNTHSRNWDNLSFYAPYLIMCTGASNNGNNNYHPDSSRYDLLASNKLGKNSIVVGACGDVIPYSGPGSVIQAPFTSWGPTDDWRIKPDITAVGRFSYSTHFLNDSDYGSGQGCSYACPVVSGGLALLQQHYHNLNSVYMRAATAKALILSTADEAGLYDGPDFSNGWGLFNAQKAAEVISNNGVHSNILELSLTQDSIYTTSIFVDGTDTLSVALCWNDPAATPLSGSNINNTTPMLVNDLDLRVYSNDTTFYPWKMEPNAAANNYTDAAVKGDNYRDNVEIIEVKHIQAGIYTVQVSHKSSLQGGLQDFSLIVNGIEQPLSIQNIPQHGFKVYPNPTNELLHIELTENNVDIKIYALDGQLMYTKDNINEKTHVVSMKMAPAGVYLLEMQTKKGKVLHQFVKH